MHDIIPGIVHGPVNRFFVLPDLVIFTEHI